MRCCGKRMQLHFGPSLLHETACTGCIMRRHESISLITALLTNSGSMPACCCSSPPSPHTVSSSCNLAYHLLEPAMQNGCVNCVWDMYDAALQAWSARVAAAEAAAAVANGRVSGSSSSSSSSRPASGRNSSQPTSGGSSSSSGSSSCTPKDGATPEQQAGSCAAAGKVPATPAPSVPTAPQPPACQPNSVSSVSRAAFDELEKQLAQPPGHAG